MEITVNVLGEARGRLGSPRVVASAGGKGCEELPLASVLSHACDQAPDPDAARTFLFPGGIHLNPSVLVMVNGVDHRILGGLDGLVRAGDEVTVLPVLHGG